MTSRCELCLEDNVGFEHGISSNHLRNKAIIEYSLGRMQLSENRNDIFIKCNVYSAQKNVDAGSNPNINISVKPNEEVKFGFTVINESTKHNVLLEFAQLPNNKINFCIDEKDVHIARFPEKLKPKTKLHKEICVTFQSPLIGQYELPIFFLISMEHSDERIFIMRCMTVFVEEQQTPHEMVTSPYAQQNVTANLRMKTKVRRYEGIFRIPMNYKHIYARNLLSDEDDDEQVKGLTEDIRNIFSTGVTPDNYIPFFHNLLWYEETIARINLKKYNMTGVHIKREHYRYSLTVPGLAEKRPSLMLGDLLFVKPEKEDVMFEAVISDKEENVIFLKGFHDDFHLYHRNTALFNVRFFMGRVIMERMHVAVNNIENSGHIAKIFPVQNRKLPTVKPILDYYNLSVKNNPEQRQAVEHIVAGTAGPAPFLLHGPPGTGKTVTIVEAILQLVQSSDANRILVCTDSNMAADHVATMLIKYSHMFESHCFLLRANSKFRVWETLPECLIKYSNGKSLATYEPIYVKDFLKYRIIVTTLSHAAMYAFQFKTKGLAMPISHLFIDEASQSTEPASLIPTSGLLQAGQPLVLAGDPQQLGPVVISNAAKKTGLGLSLMERLKTTCPLYDDKNEDNSYYEVMLRNNFRSHKDILELPNELFYDNKLRVHAKEDAISKIDILGEQTKSAAIVFHGVLSQEQRMGKSPSFYNDMEAQIVWKYVTKLINVHSVIQDDIGIVTPYIRQVYKIKKWLERNHYHKIEVGTVEAFQGKEKRVILISTVRANCGLLDHDAKFQLGFLVDDKRFNVAVTRAKAKLIIIGNPLCLQKDEKWRRYIQKCRELGTYHGFDSAQYEETQNEVVDQITPMLKTISLAQSSE